MSGADAHTLIARFRAKWPRRRRKSILTCSYCGFLDWTIKRYGRVTHKCNCPFRIDSYCQSHADVCDA